MTSLARASVPVALFALLVGCKSNNIKSDNQYVSEMVGSEGKELKLDDGASVVIPPAALKQTYQVTLGSVSSGYPALQGIVATSSIYSLEPQDLAFDLPVTFKVPGTQGSVFSALTNGMWMDLQGMPNGQGFLTAQSIQPGYFTAATGDSTRKGDGTGGSSGSTMMSMSGDGTASLTGINSQVMNVVVGETYAFWLEATTDQFGQTTTTIQAGTLDSQDPPTTVATPAQGTPTGVIAIGDYAYWADGMAAGNASLNRCKPGGTPEVVATVKDAMNLAVSEGSLLFPDQNQQLGLYDGLTGMLDPTMYTDTSGLPGGGLFQSFARSLDHVFMLKGGMASPYEIWSGAVGSPLADSTLNFPGGAMLQAVGAVGSTLVIATSAGSQDNVITFDTANPAAGSKTIASFAGGSMVGGAGGGAGQPRGMLVDGGFLYASLAATNTAMGGTPTMGLIKIDLSNGTQTTLGTLAGGQSGNGLSLNSKNLYMLLHAQAGGTLYRWAR